MQQPPVGQVMKSCCSLTLVRLTKMERLHGGVIINQLRCTDVQTVGNPHACITTTRWFKTYITGLNRTANITVVMSHSV